MKQLLATLLAASILVTFSGCVNRSEGQGAPESSSSMPEAVSSEPQSTPSEEPSQPADTFTPHVPAMGSDFEKVAALDTSKVQWGPGYQRDEKNRSTACLQLQEQYGHYNANFIGPEAQKIYLTFDEGYENGNTAKILMC